MMLLLVISMSFSSFDFEERIVNARELGQTFSGLKWDARPKKTLKALKAFGASRVAPSKFFEKRENQEAYWHLFHFYTNKRIQRKKKWRYESYRFDVFEKRRSVIVAEFYRKRLGTVYHITPSSVRVFRPADSNVKEPVFDFRTILEKKQDTEPNLTLQDIWAQGATLDPTPAEDLLPRLEAPPPSESHLEELEARESGGREQTNHSPTEATSPSVSNKPDPEAPKVPTTKIPTFDLPNPQPKSKASKTENPITYVRGPAYSAAPESPFPTYGLLILLLTISLLLSFTYRGRVKLNNRFKQQARHHQEAQTVIGRLSHELSHVREQCERYNCQISELEAQKKELERQNLDLRYQKNAHTKKGDGFIDRTKKFVHRCREVDTRKYRSCKTSLQKAFHPDHYPAELQDEATELSKEINSLF